MLHTFTCHTAHSLHLRYDPPSFTLLLGQFMHWTLHVSFFSDVRHDFYYSDGVYSVLKSLYVYYYSTVYSITFSSVHVAINVELFYV